MKNEANKTSNYRTNQKTNDQNNPFETIPLLLPSSNLAEIQREKHCSQPKSFRNFSGASFLTPNLLKR